MTLSWNKIWMTLTWNKKDHAEGAKNFLMKDLRQNSPKAIMTLDVRLWTLKWPSWYSCNRFVLRESVIPTNFGCKCQITYTTEAKH